MTAQQFSKYWFIISLLIGAFIYGVAVERWQLFPHSFISLAIDQGRQFFRSEPDRLVRHDEMFDRVGNVTIHPAIDPLPAPARAGT